MLVVTVIALQIAATLALVGVFKAGKSAHRLEIDLVALDKSILDSKGQPFDGNTPG